MLIKGTPLEYVLLEYYSLPEERREKIAESIPHAAVIDFIEILISPGLRRVAAKFNYSYCEIVKSASYAVGII